MKKTISWQVAVGIVIVAGAVLFAISWKSASPPAPGPDPQEALKHMGADSVRNAISKGPPPGPPPPGGDRNPMLKKP